MSLKVYTYPNNPRVWKAQIAGKYVGVELEEVAVEMGVTNKTKEFLAMNPLGKVPTLETPEGAVWESNAIARYVARRGESALFGGSAIEAAHVDQWIDYAANEIDLPAAAWLYPIFGLVAENSQATSAARKDIRAVLKTLDDHLRLRTYLVSEKVTLADIIVAMSLLPLYKLVLDTGFRKAFTNTNRWFDTIINQPQAAAVIGKFEYATKMAKAKPVAVADAKKEAPKKQQQQQKQQQQKKEAPKKAEAPEAEKPKAKPKTVRQLMAELPKAEYNSLAPFKTTYVNEAWADSKAEFEKDLIPAIKRKEYTLYLAKHKHPEDLQQGFMASNMIGGLFQRLEQGRDYGVGSMLVFQLPEEGGHQIQGAMIFRGSELPEFVADGPDFMVYDYSVVDVDNKEQMELVYALLAWEGDALNTIGKYVDGKIFK